MIHHNGRLVEDSAFSGPGAPPWIGTGRDELTPQLAGAKISWIEVAPRSLSIRFSNGDHMEIVDAPDRRPKFAGSGRPRILEPGEDLRRGVFLSPTEEIWV